MASALRTKAPLRTVQSFTATSSKLPAAIASRNLHMTSSREASPALSNFERSMADVPARAKNSSASTTRTFNTSRVHKSVHDTSTVDFAYFPDHQTLSFSNPSASTELPQIPLLPDNYTAKASPEHVAAPEPAVHMPEISTSSLGSAISAFGEAEQSKAADMIGLVEEKVKGEIGGVKRVLGDMWDDLLGGGAAVVVRKAV